MKKAFLISLLSFTAVFCNAQSRLHLHGGVQNFTSTGSTTGNLTFQTSTTANQCIVVDQPSNTVYFVSNNAFYQSHYISKSVSQLPGGQTLYQYGLEDVNEVEEPLPPLTIDQCIAILLAILGW